MAKYSVDRNGNVTVNKTEEKKKKKSKYHRDINGNVTVNTVEDDDIAPVRADVGTAQTEKQERTWFQSGALGNGLSKENVKKTYFGTVADFWENLGTGVIGIGGKALDAMLTLAPYIAQGQYYQNGGGFNLQADQAFTQSIAQTKVGTADLVAKDLYDEQAVAKKIISNPIERMTGANTDSDSLFGQKSEGLLQSTGQLGGQIALQAVGVPWWLTSAATTLGAESKSSIREGADLDSAAVRGAISASAEVLTEKIGGIKFKGAALDEGITKVIARGMSNKAARTLAKIGVDAGSEALEEGLSWFAGKFGEYITSNGEETFAQLLGSEEAMDELVESMIGGAVMGGGFGTANAAEAKAKGKDYASGFTANEQKVIDKVYKDLVAEESKNGKVSQAKKNELYDQAVAAMDKGYIGTDTIEEVLGGEDFKAYQTAQEKENAVLKELEGLYQGEELAAQQQSIRDNTTLTQLRQTMGDKVAELVKSDRLAESYREKGRRSQIFQADLSQYDEKQRTIVQKAIDSGVLNNTNRSHELVDLIAKVGADKALDFDFTNNEKLKASGFALNGKTVNGYVSGSGVTVNINSAKALNSVVGHEITHVLEGTGKFYTALESMVTEYAKTKGEYNARLTELRSLYADVDGYKGADGHEKIKKELVADLVGDYIFTDTDFISRLSTENRSVFEKIYDEIQYLCRVATAGSKEARQLEKAKKAFEDAYRQDAKNTAEDGGVRYSVSQRNSASGYVDKSREGGYDFTKSFAEQIEDYQNGVFPEKDTFLVGKTPDVLTRIGLAKLPLTMNQTHVDYSLNGSYKGSAERVNDHMLSPEQLAEIPELVADPVAIIQDRQLWEKKAREYSVDVLVGMEINGKKTLVPINVNSRGQINGTEIDSNRIQTVHGNTDTVQRLINALNEDSAENVAVFYVNKEKAAEFLRPAGNPISRAAQELDGFIHSINDPGSPVKMRISSETESQQFKRWFGDWQNHPENASKVVNADGTPKVVYHGSWKNFSIFDGNTNKHSNAPKGAHFFTDDIDVGYSYTGYKDIAAPAGHSYKGGVYPVYLDIKKPYTVDFGGKLWSEKIDGKDINEHAQYAKENGYDGLIAYNIIDEGGQGDKMWNEDTPRKPATDYVVFDSAQIKSATDNIGTFDGSNPDIRYSVSSQKDLFPVRKDLDAVRGNIYGSDVELEDVFPVLKAMRENSHSPQEDLFPVRKDLDAVQGNSYSSLEDKFPVRKDLKPGRSEVNDSGVAMRDLGPIRKDLTSVAARYTDAQRDIAPVRDDLKSPTQAENPIERQRKWVKTSTESEALGKSIFAADLEQNKITYHAISNKETLRKANAKLDTMGYDTAIQYFNNQIYNDRVSLDDIAIGERLIQEAIMRGDNRIAGELIQNVAILGTELGQKVQALSLIQKMTPEGQLGALKKIVDRGKFKGDITFNGVEITQDMIDHILDAYNKDGFYDQDVLNKAVEDVKQKIAEQMGVTVTEKVNAWRYLSMLGNPKTHIRNLVSNLAMAGTTAVKDAVARTVETFVPISDRTKTWKQASKDVRDFAKQTTLEMKNEISGEGKYSNTSDIKSKRKIFQNEILQKIYGFNSDLLGKEDWWFSKAAFKTSLQEFLTANGIETAEDIARNPEIVEKGKQYALERAEIATFRQYSWLASKISSIEQKNAATQIAIGAVIPFKKTPINVAKAGLSYSPLGFVKTLTYDIAQVKKGNMDASTLIDHLSQNLTGTGLALAGYLLAKVGFLNGAGEDDKEGTYDYYLGKQAYSVNIGGNSYTLSWMSPTAMPLFVGANMYEQLVEGKEWNADVVLETLAQTLDPMSEMSFLSSLDDVLSSYDSGMEKFAGIGISALSSYASQFLPTALSQAAATIDDTKRTTKVAADSGMKVIDEVVNQLIYKIPGLRQLLQPSTDIWGNDIRQDENVAARAVGNFIAPWSKKADISSEVDEEIKKIYHLVGDNGLLPSIPGNTVTYMNEKYLMSAEEYTDFKKAYGQVAFETLKKLFRTESYQKASVEEKADMIGDVYTYARDTAKREYLAKEGVAYTNATKDKVPYYRENPIKGAIENDMSAEEFAYASENPEKYEAEQSGSVYAVTDDGHYRWYEPDEDAENPEPGWRKISEKELERQNKVTAALGITPEEYWGDKREEYNYAYENPEKYLVIKAAGGYEKYTAYKKEINKLESDKDKDGNTISGSKKNKVIKYINSLKAEYGEKLVLFKSLYPADDKYNEKIVQYLNSRKDLTAAEKKKILEELDFKVQADGTVTW